MNSTIKISYQTAQLLHGLLMKVSINASEPDFDTISQAIIQARQELEVGLQQQKESLHKGEVRNN